MAARRRGLRGLRWVCQEERGSQDGVELADSLVINPHKWLMVPMDCSPLDARPEELRTAFSLTPEYLRTTTSDALSASTGRRSAGRFRSLKLWAVLRCYGREGLQAMLREHVRLARSVRGAGSRRAGLGALRAAALLARLFPAQRLGTRRTSAMVERVERERRDVPLAHEAPRPLGAAARNRQCAHHRGTTSGAPGTYSTGRHEHDRHDHERRSRLRGRRGLR